MLLGLVSSLQGGKCELHQTVSPVIWRKSNIPVAMGFDLVKLTIELRSPCEFLPLDDMEPKIKQIVTRKCNEQFNQLFLKELEKICPTLSFSNHHLEKRELLLAGALILGVGSAIGGLGISGATAYKTYQLNEQIEDMEDELAELERQAHESKSREIFFKDELLKITKEVERTSLYLND